MSPTTSTAPHQHVGSYPMTQRRCECGTLLIASFQSDTRHPFYNSTLPSPRPILYCPTCSSRASRVPPSVPPQDPVYQYSPAIQALQNYYHAWLPGAQDGHHNPYHLGLPSHGHGLPLGNSAYWYTFPNGLASGADGSYYTHYGTGMEQPRQQTQLQSHQYRSQEPLPSPGPPSIPTPRYLGSVPPILPATPGHVPFTLPRTSHHPDGRQLYSRNQTTIDPRGRGSFMSTVIEPPREATDSPQGVQDPAFWVSSRTNRNRKSSRSSGGSSSSTIRRTPAPLPEAADTTSEEDEEHSSRGKHKERCENNEDAQESDDDFPALAFAENGDIILLSDEFTVPSRSEALREAGPTTGPAQVVSSHTCLDDDGTERTIVIKEDVQASDWTMSGGLA
ncbi:hypothetical protein F5Y05DRAFT_154943 [Hypoxylon sp. FL0543]|nr:hypothetical protein F5Y05DRAFT_154943 [Hypoxylon sp. FL0543]